MKWASAWDFQQCGMCDQQSLRSACAYAQSDQSLCYSLEYSMSFKLLTEHHLEFLRLSGRYTGSSESTLVKMPHCWKSHVTAKMSPPVLSNLVGIGDCSVYAFRYQDLLQVPQVRTTKYGKESLRFAAGALWNTFPDHFRQKAIFGHS